MQLISDIINDLINSDKSISSALLKTKVLASRIKNQELLEWVNKELNGYVFGDKLPEYRKCLGSVIGTYYNSGWQFKEQPLPTYGLPDDYEKRYRQIEFYHSVTSLEGIEKDNESGILESVFPHELVSFLEEHIRQKGNYEFSIIRLAKRVSLASLTQVLSVIRSKLLDFMLQIDEQFGNIADIEELKNKNETINNIMNQTIINTGDGNILNTGDNSTINAEIKVIKDDKGTLRKRLSDSGISETDIDELLEIIDKEKPDETSKTFGENVNNWIQKMIGKALNGVWKIGIGAAGSILTKFISDYYGI